MQVTKYTTFPCLMSLVKRNTYDVFLSVTRVYQSMKHVETDTTLKISKYRNVPR